MNCAQNPFSKQSSYKPINIVKLQPPWWIKIATSEPKCLYYFGSFDSHKDATDALSGYVKDLEEEQAKGILVEIKQDNPHQLTVCENLF